MQNYQTSKLISRFCKYGHDKLAPHGTYIKQLKNGKTWYECAECARLYQVKRWHKLDKQKKEEEIQKMIQRRKEKKLIS